MMSGTAAVGTVMTGTAAVTMVALVRGIYSSVLWRSLGGVAIVDTIFGGWQRPVYYQPVVYQQPVYYQPPPPVCWFERSPVFDAYGRPVGTMPTQRCTTQQPY